MSLPTMPIFKGRVKEERKALFGKYEVSDQGIVYSDGVPLAAIGGVGVNLGGKRVKICELVATAFLGEGEGRWVRHKNGDPTDNRACNLEWCGEKEEKPRGRKSRERLIRAVTKEGDVVGQWRSVQDASAESGVGEEGIRACLRGKQKSAGGLLWI